MVSYSHTNVSVLPYPQELLQPLSCPAPKLCYDQPPEPVQDLANLQCSTSSTRLFRYLKSCEQCAEHRGEHFIYYYLASAVSTCCNNLYSCTSDCGGSYFSNENSVSSDQSDCHTLWGGSWVRSCISGAKLSYLISYEAGTFSVWFSFCTFLFCCLDSIIC